MTEARFDLIGVDSLHGAALSGSGKPYEVRVRVAGRTDSLAEAVRIGNEVETLYTNGPAGGGGAFKSAREVVAVAVRAAARGPCRTQHSSLRIVSPVMKLRDLAHSRTGDKGNTSNISVIAFDRAHYDFLREHVTAERVKAHFADVVRAR